MNPGGGGEYSSNNSEYWNVGLNVMFRYVPTLFTLWVEGSPLPMYANIEFGGTFNVTPFLGIGAACGMYFDNEIDYVELNYLHFGFMVRPRISFEFGLFIGGSLGGVVWTETNNKVTDIPGTWAFPANFNVWLLYKFNDNISIRVKYLGVELANFDYIAPYDYPNSEFEYAGAFEHSLDIFWSVDSSSDTSIIFKRFYKGIDFFRPRWKSGFKLLDNLRTFS